MEIVVGALLISTVIAAILYPLWRPALEPVDGPVGPAAELAELESRKAAIYGSIRDLGFDFRTDKISADDHRQESATLKREAVTVLAAIEQLRSHPPRGPAELERIIAGLAASTQEDAPSTESHELAEAGASAHPEIPGAQLDGGPTRTLCTRCGHRAQPADRFCAGCGTALSGS